LRSEQVTDSIAWLDVVDSRSNRFHDSDGIGAETVGQRQRIAAGAKVDVDEVHRDVGVTHPRLARAGLADLDFSQAKDFRTAETVETDRACHDQAALPRTTSAARTGRFGAKPLAASVSSMLL